VVTAFVHLVSEAQYVPRAGIHTTATSLALQRVDSGVRAGTLFSVSISHRAVCLLSSIRRIVRRAFFHVTLAWWQQRGHRSRLSPRPPVESPRV
jgi:hypothetical protein